MRKILQNWLLPFLVSIILVTSIRLFILDFTTVQDTSMEYSLRAGDKILYSKIGNPKPTDVVLLKNFPLEESLKITRLIGMPGDTVQLTNSLVYVNKRKIREPQGVSHPYFFRTDSLKLAIAVLKNERIGYNKIYARIGQFNFRANMEQIRRIKAVKAFRGLKRQIDLIPATIEPVLPNQPNRYTNKDHYGPVLIPYIGFTINMDLPSFYRYKSLIEAETGKTLATGSKEFFLNDLPIQTYTFQSDYYFVLNDNRSDCYDSRLLGMVPREAIYGLFVAKFGWD
jgi:signal peptidase I